MALVTEIVRSITATFKALMFHEDRLEVYSYLIWDDVYRRCTHQLSILLFAKSMLKQPITRPGIEPLLFLPVLNDILRTA